MYNSHKPTIPTGKPLYVTDKALDRIINAQPGTYHMKKDCTYIRRFGGKAQLVSQQDIVDNLKYFKPCTKCVTFLEEPKVKLPAPDTAAMPDGAKTTTTMGIERPNGKVDDTRPWPRPEQITIWHCSDGREWSTEVEALRHELDIRMKGR